MVRTEFELGSQHLLERAQKSNQNWLVINLKLVRRNKHRKQICRHFLRKSEQKVSVFGDIKQLSRRFFLERAEHYHKDFGFKF